jgi:glucosylceramidase
LGAVTIDGNNITRNPAYYIVAHAAKFVRPDAVRVESTVIDGLANVAFKNSDGKMVLIVANTSTERKAFAIVINGKSFSSMLNAGAVGTYVW